MPTLLSYLPMLRGEALACDGGLVWKRKCNHYDAEPLLHSGCMEVSRALKYFTWAFREAWKLLICPFSQLPQLFYSASPRITFAKSWKEQEISDVQKSNPVHVFAVRIHSIILSYVLFFSTTVKFHCLYTFCHWDNVKIFYSQFLDNFPENLVIV